MDKGVRYDSEIMCRLGGKPARGCQLRLDHVVAFSLSQSAALVLKASNCLKASNSSYTCVRRLPIHGPDVTCTIDSMPSVLSVK